MSNLSELTTLLGIAYRSWKSSEIEKNTLKEEFFEEATRSFNPRTVATKVVSVPQAKSFEEAKDYAIKHNPFWKVIDIHLDDFGKYSVGMQEDFALKPFAYVNEEDGMVYQRTVVEGSVMLDDERLQKEDPELWKQITRTKTVEEVIPFEELNPEVLEQVSNYLYQTKPTVKFLAPRKARDDEL